MKYRMPDNQRVFRIHQSPKAKEEWTEERRGEVGKN